MPDSKLDAEAPLIVPKEEYLLEAKVQAGIDAGNSGHPERMRLLASQDRLGLGDWIEIFGVGIKDAPRYTITAEGVSFDVWDEGFFASYPPHQQTSVLRQNGEPGLLFPCTPRELLDFVDNGAGRLFGSFHVPEEFRNAVAKRGRSPKPDARTELAEAKLARTEKIPGTLPKTANGRLGVQAAWEIELELGRPATAKEAMTRLREWARLGEKPETLKEEGKDGRSVVWITNKRAERNYAIEAFEKTLEKWHASRNRAEPGQNIDPASGH